MKKRLKRIVVLMLVGIFAVTFGGCSNLFNKLFIGTSAHKEIEAEDEKVTKETKPESEIIRIGFLLKTMQEERYEKDKKFFIESAYAAGADEVIFDSAGNDEGVQERKFLEMLDRDADVIVLQPVNTNTAGKMVEIAHKRGVKVVGYDSMLSNGPLDAHVMQDSWSVGKIQGEAMVKWLKDKKGSVKGNVALIKGQPGDSNAKAMSLGAIITIKSNPNLNLVVDEYHEGWSPELAKKTASDALDKYNGDIDAFICNNSGMAKGVIDALKERGLADSDEVFVAGSDAALVNIQYVAQGIQTVEIFKKIRPLAEMAAKTAVKLAENPLKDTELVIEYDKMISNNYQDVPTIVTPVVKVTKNTIDETVIASGFHSRNDIYNY